MTKTDWGWGAFGFLLMTAYWPNIAGAPTTGRWGLAALLAIPLFFAPKLRMTSVHWLGLALIGWLVVSLLWSEGRNDGIDAALKMVVVVIVFALAASTLRSLEPLIAGAALGIGISSGIAMAQAFGWHGIEQYDSGFAGLFFNRDRLAAVAALVAIGVIAYRRLWPLLPLLLPSLILAPSRAAWLALVVGLIVLWLPAGSLSVGQRGGRLPESEPAVAGRHAIVRRSRFTIPALILAVTIAGALAVLIVRGFGPSAQERLDLWGDTINGLTWFGHGLGSFRNAFPNVAHLYDIMARRSQPDHPHNEILWLAFEGGIPAVALFAAFAYRLWSACMDDAAKAILAGLFVLSLFAMPLHDPATLVLGSLCAGLVAGRSALVRNVAVDRGHALRQGLASGFAAAGLGRTPDRAADLSVPAAISGRVGGPAEAGR